MASLWQRATSRGGALVIGGLLIWLMAWAIDLSQQVGGQISCDPNLHCHDSLVRVNFPLSGFPLIVLGAVLLLGSERLLRRGNTPLFVAGMLLTLDGLVHAFSFNDHLDQPLSAAAFAVIAPAQIALGLAMPYLDRRLDVWWWTFTGAIIVAYIVSRTVSVPALGYPEAVGGMDVFSKAIEVVVLAILGPHAWQALTTRRQQVRPTSDARPTAE